MKDVSVEDIRYIARKGITHELVHAFLYESGLGEDWEHNRWGHEETTVDWIAKQIDKIKNATEIIFEKLLPYEIEV